MRIPPAWTSAPAVPYRLTLLLPRDGGTYGHHNGSCRRYGSKAPPSSSPWPDGSTTVSGHAASLRLVLPALLQARTPSPQSAPDRSARHRRSDLGSGLLWSDRPSGSINPCHDSNAGHGAVALHSAGPAMLPYNPQNLAKRLAVCGISRYVSQMYLKTPVVKEP